VTIETRGERLGRAALPILAILSFVLGVASTIAVAGDTLGYDYQAYASAADRLIHGQPLYDATVEVAGPFAIYLYPPPFAVGFIPFVLLPTPAGLWIWIAGCVAMTVAAIAILPTSVPVRWAILLLAGLDWPVVYSIKLGQVGPLLLLVFALGWRLRRSEAALGILGAAGTLVKVQPALLFAWALLTNRRRAIAIGLAVGLAAVIATLPLVAITDWVDYVRLLGKVSAPVTTPHNMTAGAVAYQAGLPESLASAIQVVGLVVTVAVWVYASRRRSAEVGYLVTVVASQLLSPLLWDHYAMLLLLPVAWLLQRRQWWAILIPLAMSLPLVGLTPPVVYPIAFFVCLIVPLVVPRSEREDVAGEAVA
jgi:hypothetical protein